MLALWLLVPHLVRRVLGVSDFEYGWSFVADFGVIFHLSLLKHRWRLKALIERVFRLFRRWSHFKLQVFSRFNLFVLLTLHSTAFRYLLCKILLLHIKLPGAAHSLLIRLLTRLRLVCLRIELYLVKLRLQFFVRLFHLIKRIKSLFCCFEMAHSVIFSSHVLLLILHGAHS